MDYEPIFVGRSNEIDAFTSMLERRARYRVLALPGPGGIGKTKLLRRMLSICQQRDILHSGLVDFYYTDLQTRAGLLDDLSSRLDAEHFPELAEPLKMSGTGPPALREEMLDRAVDKFISGFRELADGRLVALFFDTFEKATEVGVAEWFLADVLPKMPDSSIVVLAGRNDFFLGDDKRETEKEYEPAVIPLAEEEVRLLPVEPFSLAEVKEYLREYLMKRGQGEVQLMVDPERYVDLAEPPAEVSVIWEKSEGHPVIVALAADWLAEWGTGSLMDVETLSPEQFKRVMVSKVRDLESPEDEAIVRMAHVYHRFSAEVLEVVYPELKEEGFNPEEVIRNLSRLSFVKYWPETGVCLLHDEMQRLVEEYVWNEIDPVKEVRREISARAVDYYDQALAETTEERARWSLMAERIYHRLYSDLESARPEFWHQMDDAWGAYKLDLMKMLLAKGAEVNTRLKDPLLYVLCHGSRAWVYLEEWNLEEARKEADSVLASPARTRRTSATARAALGVYADRKGDAGYAIGRYQDALETYRDLEKDLEEDRDIPDEAGIPSLRGIRLEIAMLLNLIGIVHRRQGLLDDAIEYYNQAREVAREEKDLEWWSAALNNIGNVERLRGNLLLARNLCEKALRYREKLHEKEPGTAYLRDIALSHNTLGMVYRDMQDLDKAEQHFEKARDIFEQLHDRSGLARAIRNIGWVTYLKGKEAREESTKQARFKEALSHYERSHRICEQFDIEPELTNLLNKIGIVQRRIGDVDAAHQSFADSLELARDQNDSLFIANNLVRLAEMAYHSGQTEQVERYAEEVHGFLEKGYRFGLVYAEMEKVLAEVRMDAGEYEEAFRHIGQDYAHLARLNRWRFNRRIEDIHAFFDRLPSEEWRERCAKQLMDFWRQEELAREYADLTAICEEYIIGV